MFIQCQQASGDNTTITKRAYGKHHLRDVPVFGPPSWKIIGIFSMDFFFSNFEYQLRIWYMDALGLAVTVWLVFDAVDKPYTFCM